MGISRIRYVLFLHSLDTVLVFRLGRILNFGIYFWTSLSGVSESVKTSPIVYREGL